MFPPGRSFWLAIAVLLVGLAPVHAQFVVLDTFDLPAGGQSVGTGQPKTGAFSSVTGVGFLNATRDVSWDGGTGNFGSGEIISINTPADPGVLFFATIQSSVELTLQYSSFGTADLSGYTGIELDFSLLDAAAVSGGGFVIDVNLSTTSGNLTGTHTVTTAGPQVVFIPFSSLSGPGSLSNVTQIVLKLNDGGTPNQSADFILSELRLPLVPEPGSRVLLGLGSLGVVGLALRRRKG
jgi:hypothetical protein